MTIRLRNTLIGLDASLNVELADVATTEAFHQALDNAGVPQTPEEIGLDVLENLRLRTKAQLEE